MVRRDSQGKGSLSKLIAALVVYIGTLTAAIAAVASLFWSFYSLSLAIQAILSLSLQVILLAVGAFIIMYIFRMFVSTTNERRR